MQLMGPIMFGVVMAFVVYGTLRLVEWFTRGK